MFNGATLAIIWTAVILFFIFGFLAIVLRGTPERWAILGTIASVLAIVVSIAIAIIQDSKEMHGKPSAGDSQSAKSPPGPPALHSQQAKPAPSPGVTSLPAGSRLRRNILSMDQVCSNLGLSQHAWLPGQATSTNLSGRVIAGSGAAYTWSCTKNGPKLSRNDITRGCQIWYPGTRAYTWDPNNAYSWVCI
jgi:hypothetical protein